MWNLDGWSAFLVSFLATSTTHWLVQGRVGKAQAYLNAFPGYVTAVAVVFLATLGIACWPAGATLTWPNMGGLHDPMELAHRARGGHAVRVLAAVLLGYLLRRGFALNFSLARPHADAFAVGPRLQLLLCAALLVVLPGPDQAELLSVTLWSLAVGIAGHQLVRIQQRAAAQRKRLAKVAEVMHVE